MNLQNIEAEHDSEYHRALQTELASATLQYLGAISTLNKISFRNIFCLTD